MRSNRTFTLTFTAIGIVINIVLGTLVSMLQIPLIFLDTLGTILTAVLLGPWYGAIAGGLTNVIQGLITNPKNIPFALVNIAVGLIVGFAARKKEFGYVRALVVGLILAVVAPAIGTCIAVGVFGGLTGSINDIFFTWLVKSGQSVFSSAFIPRITGNIIDKIVSCLLVAFLLTRIPKKLTEGKIGN